MTLRVRDIPHTYAEVDKLLGKRKLRNVSNSGFLVRNPDGLDIYLKLYQTVIVRYFPQGSMKLDCGHYPTVTTQHWINSALSGWRNAGFHSCGHISRDTIKDIVNGYTYNRLIYTAPAIWGFAYGKVLPVIISPDGRVEKC